MIITVATILGLVLLVDLWVLVGFPGKSTIPGVDPLPEISILIAVRNEVHNVEAMIENLSQLDYPPDLLKIYIGDDASTDGTFALLERLIQGKSGFHLLRINQEGPLLGKARAIEQLVAAAATEYYLITDADVRVPPTWAGCMARFGSQGYGAWGGCTTVVGQNLWGQLQNMDWLLAQGMLLSAGKLYGALALSGTNMAISQSACQAIGGYSQIPYPLTEDIGFLTAATRKGYQAKLIDHTEACASIPAQENWLTLIKQRARWTYGATKLPITVVTVLSFRALFVVFTLMLAWYQPPLAIAVLLVRQMTQGIIIHRMARRLNQSIKGTGFLFFEVYYTLVTLGGLILYVLPFKVTWKGRKYL